MCSIGCRWFQSQKEFPILAVYTCFFVLFVWNFCVFWSFLSIFGHHLRSENKKRATRVSYEVVQRRFINGAPLWFLIYVEAIKRCPSFAFLSFFSFFSRFLYSFRFGELFRLLKSLAPIEHQLTHRSSSLGSTSCHPQMLEGVSLTASRFQR